MEWCIDWTREGVKKPIESMIIIIPRWTPPPSFLRTVIVLGFFSFLRCFFPINWVTNSLIHQITHSSVVELRTFFMIRVMRVYIEIMYFLFVKQALIGILKSIGIQGFAFLFKGPLTQLYSYTVKTRYCCKSSLSQNLWSKLFL